ncbi:cytochrome b/b6 domain-containing protein [Thiohalomonas denitrificans]|uniref:cytochrome b/b6 domain-containing protein n=1 Tax=Thiohalomonas denitrificans TaxID=415747 RepID=UPI0026EB3F40|nr:cytochrome b/b6 domain-containing protein [Thiohalomonas denitrificans]
MQQAKFVVHRVWDRGIRWFHWINVVSVLALLGIGLVIYNGKALGISGDAKIWLKELHVWIGYVFALNLLWRVVQGFRGSHFARWRATLPFSRDFLPELRAHLGSLRSGKPRHYLGHNPLGRLMVLVLFLLLFAQAITGLVLAGTDLYYPPLGSWIAQWVAPAGVEPASLVPGNKSMVDATAWAEMREFRSPFISLHILVFFALLGAVSLHVAGVVITEIKQRVGIISAMFTGEKVLPEQPVDIPEASLEK